MLKWWRKWKLNRLEKWDEELRAKEEAGRPQLQRIVSEEADKYRDSKEPWVTIIGDTITEEGIQLALDWNDAFIKFLKAQGVTGTDDTQIVQHWLAMIAEQTAERLSIHYTDLEGKVSEYE